MAHPLVVHCKRAGGDVYVGRPSKWGNPFVIGRDGTRDEVIARYEKWLLTQSELLAALPMLAGKTLACWCAPRPCHADVLARLANATTNIEAGSSTAARAFLAAALGGTWVGAHLLEIADPWNELAVQFDDTVTETDGYATLWLVDIAVTIPGQHLGTRALLALRAFSDIHAVRLVAGPVVNRGYFAAPGRAWLHEIGDEHGDPVLAYEPPHITAGR